MAFVKLGEEMTHIEELIGKGKKQITMDQVAIESAAPMQWQMRRRPYALCRSFRQSCSA